MILLVVLGLLVVPVSVSALAWQVRGGDPDWWTADRSSAGLLPPPAAHPEAMVRVLAARTVRWRGIFAVHSWLVLKPRGASHYIRYDYTAWGDPIRRNGFIPDGHWFGHAPEVIEALDGPAAEAAIPLIERAIAAYPLNRVGDYRPWPGPNSNTFVTMALAGVPGAGGRLPPTAIGKDYPWDGRWAGWAASGTGVRITLGGYGGVTLAWVEGLEVNILGGVIGIDLRRPAIKLPGLGRIGMAA